MSEIVKLAENLRPLILELRHQTENDRRLAPPIEQALRKSDLCRMLLDTGAPPQYTPDEWLSVLETLAGAEASVSWIVWNNTLPCFWVRFLDNTGRKRLFGDPSQLFAGSTRPTGKAVPVKGGHRLSGRWSLVSGCELADYINFIALVDVPGSPAPDHPELRVFFLPKGKYSIVDTWHVGGLRGSGSHDVVVDDVFVASEESFEPGPPVATNSPISQLPMIPMMIAGLGAQFLGMAREGIAVTLEILRHKISVDPGISINERPGLLANLALHTTAVNAARQQLHTSMARMWEKVNRSLPTLEDRAELYSAGLLASKVGCAAVRDMHAAAGTPALYVDCPLERSIRDLQTMSQHVAAQSIWLEDSGRVLLGREPMNPLFML